MKKERAIQTVEEDLDSRRRVSSIREGLRKAGFSPDEVNEIVAAGIQRRKARREERQHSGRQRAVPVLVLAILIVLVTYWMAAPAGVYLVPLGLFSYGFYLWYGKPRRRND